MIKGVVPFLLKMKFQNLPSNIPSIPLFWHLKLLYFRLNMLFLNFLQIVEMKSFFKCACGVCVCLCVCFCVIMEARG